MRKQISDYDVKELIKLAVGAAPGLSSPAPWKAAPHTGSAAANTGSSGGFGKALGESLAPVGNAIWNHGGKQTLRTGLNTLHGIGTTAVGLANTAAGGIGNVGAGIGYGAGALTDAAGMTHNAKGWMADNVWRHTNNAVHAGLKDTLGGAADTLTGGYYDHDGTFALPGQHAGSAVEQMRSGIRDELGRGSGMDRAFRFTNAAGDLAAETAAFGGAGRGLNVAAKTMRGSQMAAPVLNAAAKAPVVGKPMAAAGRWLAGAAPEANMFAKTPQQYFRAAGPMSFVDEAISAHGAWQGAANPSDRPAEMREYNDVIRPHVEGAYQTQNVMNQARRGDNTDYSMTETMMNDPAMANRMRHGAVPHEVAPQLIQQSGLVPPEQTADAAAAISANAPSLTGPEATQPNPQGGPSTAQKPPTTAPSTQPAGPATQPAPPQPAQTANQPTTQPTPAAGHAGPGDKAFTDVMPTLTDESRPLPERQQLAKKTVNDYVQNNPQLLQGMQDVQAGKDNTEAAKLFQSHIDNAQNQMIRAEFEQLKQANPNANFGDPKTYSSFLSQAASTAMAKFSEMPMEHKMLTGLGLGGGLIGILSALFGGGGMAGGLLGMLGLAAGGMAGAAGGMFGDQARVQTGRLMNDAASFFGGVNVPTADKLAPGAEQQTVQQIQNAMNQTGENGQRGGWAAGQKIIDAQRAQADTLLKMPRTLAITSLMGLRGEGAPKTEAEAATLLDSIAQRHAAAGRPGFLQQQAREQARTMLRQQDKAGVLAAMLKNRGAKGPGINFIREQGVRGQFNTPENKMFLNPDGSLPAGQTEDEFIDNMLRNAYGVYPEPQPEPEKVSMNIAQQIVFKQAALKAARCWAGYEPVPGKAPYTEGSCRPKAKKKKSKEPAKK